MSLLGTIVAASLTVSGPANAELDVVQTTQARLACDESLKTAFQPDDLTTVLMVRAFSAGDPLVLEDSPVEDPMVASADVCVVKLNVGPGKAGPAEALSTSPGIGIEVWLPQSAKWNGRIHIKGGGGWAGGVHGSLSELAGTDLSASGSVAITAMEEGAVSSSTDTGHADTEHRGSFAMNPDGTINTALWRDFSERSIHELAAKTKALTAAYYGRPADYAYWNGFSTGGRQGLKSAQVYPQDFDGILVGAPAINWTRFSVGHMAPQILMERELQGVRLTAEQEQLVSNAAIDNCDMVGDVHMGYVLDPANCRYNPAIDPEVLCESDGGTNSTSACVTSAQADVFNKIWYGHTRDGSIPSPDEDNGMGVELAPNQTWYGATRGSSLSNYLQGPLTNSSTYVALALQNPAYGLPLVANETGDGEDLWRDFTYAQLENATDRGLALQPLFADIDTDNPDLSLFRNFGGKMLMYHGLADALIKPAGSTHYYNRVMEKSEQSEAVQGFFRFYLVPAMFHDFTNGTANPDAVPPLPTNEQLYNSLTEWVERDVEPARMEISNGADTIEAQRTYPLCLYPQQATYVSGDPLSAESFTCG